MRGLTFATSKQQLQESPQSPPSSLPPLYLKPVAPVGLILHCTETTTASLSLPACNGSKT